MSHKITIEAVKSKTVFIKIKNLSDQISNYINQLTNSDLKNYLIPKIEQLQNLLHQLDATVNNDLEKDIELIWSTIEHQYYGFKQINQKILSIIEKQTFNLEAAFNKWKGLTVLGLEALIAANKVINDHSLEKMIAIISDQQIPNHLQADAIIQINESNLEPVVKTYLLNKVSTMTHKSFGELTTVIANRIREQEHLETTYNDFIAAASELGFWLDPKHPLKKTLDTYDQLLYQFALIDQSQHLVENVSINSINQIRYQLGNYSGHLCEQTTDLLLEKLKTKYGYDINIIDIRRDLPDQQLWYHHQQSKKY